ncbi:HAD-IB family hydrolase [Succinatimonas hippei]|uniref:HAD family hydrolase n=1 Tax=Succinatimonas hippei TaxID=626938 RepID=UPI0020118DC8|nr:HAD-IB family hydrolase [Succinatimonas hippei]MCL1602800.1 HAD-IB family hydrolase [Succinatimonas hippei]MDM8119897.1 HAD-IB family hydrolase [Succinatimonas hippei]
MSRDLYVFDLDYTLIDADSSTLWCRYMVENHIAEDPDFLNKEKRLMDAYDRGELNVHDYIAFSMPPITKIPKEKVDAIVDDFVKNTFSNLIFKEAKELLNELKSQNESILLLSASADMIVNAVARYLGIKEAISVNIKVENGFYTDKIDGVPSFKEGKVICLEKYLLEHPEINGKITFYTDSINDLPLCLRADSVYTVNPGILLRQKALENNWPILNWKRG